MRGEKLRLCKALHLGPARGGRFGDVEYSRVMKALFYRFESCLVLPARLS